MESLWKHANSAIAQVQDLAPQPYLRASRNGRRNVSSKRLRLISPGYGHSFLPWLEPVAISAGQEIKSRTRRPRGWRLYLAVGDEDLW
jgi:hypothetical protein